jgi:hypothetical protein
LTKKASFLFLSNSDHLTSRICVQTGFCYFHIDKLNKKPFGNLSINWVTWPPLFTSHFKWPGFEYPNYLVFYDTEIHSDFVYLFIQPCKSPKFFKTFKVVLNGLKDKRAVGRGGTWTQNPFETLFVNVSIFKFQHFVPFFIKFVFQI